MPAGRKWIGKLLNSPASLRTLRDVPILGQLIHLLRHRILPADERVWASIEADPAAGLRLALSPRTGQSYVRGEAGAPIQKDLAERLQPGMVFYDRGTNIGLFTLPAARLVRAKGRVISFEPDGDSAARLRRNIERNQFANVTVIEGGTWSKSGYVSFVPADSSSPDHGLGKFVSGGYTTTAVSGDGRSNRECATIGCDQVRRGGRREATSDSPSMDDLRNAVKT